MRRPIRSFAGLASMLALSATIARAADAPTTVPASVEFTIVDADTRQPIAGASAWSRVSPGGALPMVKSDEHGKVVVPMRGAKVQYVECLAAADGHAMMRASFSGYNGPLALPETFELALPKGITIGGTIADADGNPIPEAHLTLTIEMSDLPEHVASGASWRQITADANGKWTFANAPAVWKRVQFGAYDVERGGNERGYYNLDALADADADKLRGGDFTFRLGASRPMLGRVVDANGKPVLGATVGLGDDRVASNSLPAAKVDSDGTFMIGVKPDAQVTLTFTAKGFAPELIRVANTEELGMLNQVMQPAKKLSGTVVGPDGKPVPGARVYVDTWRGARTINRSLTADAAGKFNWNDAPADAVLVDAMAPGYAANRRVSIAPDQSNVITLRQPVKFSGKIVDAETKQPIANATPVVGLLFNGQDRAPYFERDRQGREVVRVAADGTFTMSFDEPYDGRIIRIEADGYAPVDSPKVTMTDGDQSFTYEMKRAAGIAGTVVDPAGQPVPNAVVLLGVGGNNPVQIQNGDVPEYALRQTLNRKTDADGKFSFPPEPGAFAIVVCAKSGFARVDNAAFKADQPIALQPWSKVEGVAFIGSKPAAGATISGYGQDANYQQDGPRVSNSIEAKCDDAGHFTINRVPPGRWMVGRQVQAGEQSWTTVSAADVTVKPGEGATIRIGGVGRPVTGHVEVPADLKARADWGFGEFELTSKPGTMPAPLKTPEEFAKMTPDERKAFLETSEAKTWMEAQRAAYGNQKRYSGWIKSDGTFRIDDVEVGTYNATASVRLRPPGERYAYGKMLALVPPTEAVVPEGGLDDAVDLPAFEFKMQP